MSKPSKAARREKRHLRVRKSITGTAQRPRLNIFRSSKHIRAQVIDDVAGKVLVAASSLSPEVAEQLKTGANRQAARVVGKLLGQKAKGLGIQNVVFDRGGYLYHGRIKELAEGAREAGLKF